MPMDSWDPRVNQNLSSTQGCQQGDREGCVCERERVCMCVYMHVCVHARVCTVVLCEASTVQTANVRTQIIPLFPGHSGDSSLFSDSTHPMHPLQ